MSDFATFAVVIADANARGHMGDGHMSGWGVGWMWLWIVFLCVAIIAGAVWLITRGRDATTGATSSRARDILDERYARGELSTEEYRERVDQLR